MSVPAAIASGLPADPARFANAWEVFQFAARELNTARGYVVLAELTGDEIVYRIFSDRVRFLEKAAAAAEREWSKTGPAQ